MKILLDTDIGDDIDDAFALRFLLNCADVEFVGVTTVYKNVAQRARIAKNMLNLAGKGRIPVHAGVNKPLQKDIRLLLNEEVGANGLIDIDHYTHDIDGVAYDGDDAVGFMLECAKRYPHEITLVAIGPLTNVATAIQRDKEAFSLFKKVLLMGGRFNDKVSEWNVETDPQAAQIVFGSGIPTVSISFDATVKTSMTKRDVEKINASVHPADKYLAKMMNRWIEHYDPAWHGEKIPILHDVLTAAVLLDESVCVYEDTYFTLPLDGTYKDCTLRNESRLGYCTKAGIDFDKEKFFGLVERYLMRA